MKGIKWYIYLNSVIMAIILYGYIVMVTNSITMTTLGELTYYFCDYRAWLCIIGVVTILLLIYAYREFIYKHRYILALILFCLCVIFEISGSSLGMWCNYLGLEDNEVLLGVSRLFRSDEWAVSTPMMVSQYYDSPQNFSYFSHTLRGCSTDIFLEYGQPVKDILMIFRPFQIGYLFLPIAKGLAFYWCGRWIALFLVSLEFGMLLTDENKKLSVIYTMLVSFAPVIQWWFAINGLVEMVIYIELSILLLRKYMTDSSKARRLLYLFGIMVCAGGYVLTFYPAWQVPMAYVLLGLVIWTILDNYKMCRMDRWDWISIGCVFIVFLCLMLRFYDKSFETIQALLNTVYPGNRRENGGGYLSRLFNYPANVWYSIQDEGLTTNVCTEAQFFDLFPLQYILLGIYGLKTKRKDSLSMIMGGIGLFLVLYCTIGFPLLLSKVTLLSFSPAVRTIVAVGFCNIVLLIRVMERGKEIFKKVSPYIKWIVGVIFTIFVIFVIYNSNRQYFSRIMLIITIVIVGIIVELICFYNIQKVSDMLCYMIMIVMLVSGFLVNPVRIGIHSVMDSDIVTELRNIDEADEQALWIVEDWGLPMNNLGLLSGLSTVNSTNVYPNIERWKKLDYQGDNMDIYNRYAHIRMVIKDDGNTEFVPGDSPDTFLVELTRKDLIEMNVKYVLTPKELGEEYELITSVRGFNVYKILE